MNEPLRIFTEHIPGRTRALAATPSGAPSMKLVMPFEQRQKARQRVRVTAGFEVGIQLPRGTVLRGGDQLRASDGMLLDIVAAREPVSTVWSRDLRRLAQVAYHLGNRHVALEIGTGWVRYLADHVLDAMVEQLGLAVVHHDEPFEPEAGAYGGHEHARSSHAQMHQHGIAHDHTSPREHRVIFGGFHRHSHEHEQ